MLPLNCIFFLASGTSGCVINLIEGNFFFLIFPLLFGVLFLLLLFYPYCFKIRVDSFTRTFTFSLTSFLPFCLFQSKKIYNIDDILNFTLGLVQRTSYYFIRINFKKENRSETIYSNNRKVNNINIIMSGIVNQLNRILQDFK